MGASLRTYVRLPHDRDSIRLLTIEPSLNSGAPVQCNLQATRLSHQPNYEALSYRWSNDGQDFIQLDASPVSCTRNLVSALRALRQTTTARVIWVDALCIDQTSALEKSYQVPLMRQIYGTSQRAIVWLGNADKDSRAAFRAIRRNPGSYPRSLTRVLRRSWFGRVWMIQEVATSPHAVVQCGSDSLEWMQFISVVEKVSELGSMVNPTVSPEQKHLHPSFYPRVLEAARQRIVLGKRFGLQEALRWFQSFSATDPRDKIYGIIGLLEDPSGVIVDYERSVTDIYCDLALSIIRTTKRLDILLDCLQSSQPGRQPDLPSWAPDWSDIDQPLDNPLKVIAAEEAFCATCNTTNDHLTYDDGHITVSALAIAHIAELGLQIPTMQQLRQKYWPGTLPSHRFFDLIHEVVTIFTSWKAVAIRTNPQNTTLQNLYPTGETLFDAFYSTLDAYSPLELDIRTEQGYHHWALSMEYLMKIYSYHAYHIAAHLHWTLVWNVTGPFLACSSLRVALRFVQGRLVPEPPKTTSGHDATRQSWTFGRTDTGLMGLFPAPSLTSPGSLAAEKGDVVVLLRGAARPYVLRRKGKAWRVVGVAYVHGIMHGGAFDEAACEDILLC